MYRYTSCVRTDQGPVRICGGEEKDRFAFGYGGGTDTVIQVTVCDICKRPLYSGDHAYEAGDLLICEKCVTRVMV